MAVVPEVPQHARRMDASKAEEIATLTTLCAEQLAAPVDRVAPLPGGLGLRRFYRIQLRGQAGSVIARVEAEEDPGGRPAGALPEPPLEPIRALLEAAGLPVPRRLGGDPQRGICLLEDAGDQLLESARGRQDLQREAAELVPRLQAIADPGGVDAFRRSLDATLFAYKAELFSRYSLREALGREARPAETRVVRDAFAWIAQRCAEAPRRLAHRDLQSRNLLVVPRRPDGGHLVMIDLQGAFLAPPEYDLVCLLRDSYAPVPELRVAALLEDVRPQLPDAPEAELFARRFDWLTLTRKGKDHARFLYALRERGDLRYAPFVPPTVAVLRAAARRAATDAAPLQRLANLVEQLPEEVPCGG